MTTPAQVRERDETLQHIEALEREVEAKEAVIGDLADENAALKRALGRTQHDLSVAVAARGQYLPTHGGFGHR